MSATVIASLSASAETPGMPPCVTSEPGLTEPGSSEPGVSEPGLSEPGLADEGADPAFAPDFTEADSPYPIPAELGESDGAGLATDLSQPAEADVPLDVPPEAPCRDPDLWLYRDRTVALLRRYLRLSIEVGRMPSLLGREFFRTRVTRYKASTFEDSVIFVHDVEVSLEKLNEFDKQLIAKIVLQEYSHEEAGRQLGCGRRHVVRCYPEALDRVTEVFLKRGLLTRLPRTKPAVEKSCQGGKTDEFLASDSEQAKNNY
jgi:hypothetical protein